MLKPEEQKKKKPKLKVFDFDDIDEMDDQEREKQEKIWEALSSADNKEDLEREIQTLARLENQAKGVIDNEFEVKLTQLKETMIEMEKTDVDDESKKILIFTESRDTLEYLEKRIRKWGYTVNTIHGGMAQQERINAEKVFKQ